jgi:xylose isomerase
MADGLRFGAGLWMFGQFVDRYATDAYGPPVGTLEAIERAGKVGELSAVDINFPFSPPELGVAQVKEGLKKANLRAAAITPVIYNREFQKGSFTHPDAAVRRSAIERAMSAIPVARALEADYVKFWPGQDGFDYPFQCDYLQIWDYAVSGIREVCGSDKGMRFAIEYKFKEPRTHMLFSTAARTLLALEDIGADNLGIVMDLGHSLLAKETPAEEVQLIARRGKLANVELNDNWREWDDDLPVGSVHLTETLEFVHALRTLGWKGYWMLDQFPFREDCVEAARASIDTIRALHRLLDRIDLEALRASQDRQDALAAQRLVQQLFLGELGRAR